MFLVRYLERVFRRRLRVSKFIHFRIERRDSTKHLDYGDFIADAHVTYKLKIEAKKIHKEHISSFHGFYICKIQDGKRRANCSSW